MKRSIRIGLLLVILLAIAAFVVGLYTRVFPPAEVRLAEWAVPAESSNLKNFYRVSAELYRGAAPDEKGLQELKRMGVRTVINLEKNNLEEDQVRKLSMGYEHIGMSPMHAEQEDVVRFLQGVSEKDKGPFFVHCKHGSDRTGTMCAIYRIAVQGWTKDQAIAEMTEGGFGFHEGFRNLVGFIRNLDIEKVKAQARSHATSGKTN